MKYKGVEIKLTYKRNRRGAEPLRLYSASMPDARQLGEVIKLSGSLIWTRSKIDWFQSDAYKEA